jgi:hypothetical protein
MDSPEAPEGAQEDRSRKGASKRKRSPSDQRRKARRLMQQAVERASNARRDARAHGDFHAAHELDLALHGADAGVPKNFAPKKRPDPYLVSHGGLYAKRRKIGPPVPEIPAGDRLRSRSPIGRAR